MKNSLNAILLEQDPYEGMNKIVDVLSAYDVFVQPELFFISVLDGCYKSMPREGNVISFLPIDYTINKKNSIIAERDGCVVAFVLGNTREDITVEIRELVSGLLLHFHDLCFLTTYFKEIRKPIDFTNVKSYYHETSALLSCALGMPMVAIRKLKNISDLEGLCFYEKDQPPKIGRSFHSEDMPAPFLEALREAERSIEKNQAEEIHPYFHCKIDINDAKYEFLKTDPIFDGIKTFMIFPIFYGHELFGMMSCAARCNYTFSNIQKHAFSGLMQIVGVAISNFVRYHESQELHGLHTDQIIDTTAVEVAKSTKHELSNAQAEVSTMLVSLKRAFDINQTKRIQPVLNSLESAVDKLLPSIQKLSFGDAADRALEKTTIREIWEDVTKLFSERLKRSDISTNYQGPTCKGQYYSEMLRNAFLNLMLNSIDAFKSQRKRGRKITIVTTLTVNETHCQIDYSDNAGGLNLVRPSYRVPDHIISAYPETPLKELIFHPKVSSKGGAGSGWGLYLVRRAIGMHRGSINLVNYKNGCTFRINMPLHQPKRQ